MLPFPGRKEIIIFMAYAQANHKDAQKLQWVLQMLAQLPKVLSYDIDISAGLEWKQEEYARLHAADIILLLVSWQFLVSPYCSSTQLGQAIQRHKDNKARVIPIILQECPWQDSALHPLAPLPTHGKPLNQWRDWAQALTDIYNGIKRVIDELQNPPLPRSAPGA